MADSRRVLILGLDGATFDVIRPLAAAGRLPNLTRWMDEGAHAPLLSTVPAMTFPAWSSFLTGLGPGRHGIFDFSQKLPGAYRIRFSNATDRQGASLFARASRAGRSVLSLGMPATYPPEPLRGLSVCGFDAPVSSGTDASSASDPALYRAIAARVGPWMRPELDESGLGDETSERAVETLRRRLRRKTDFALEALRQLTAAGNAPELVSIVFSESDTVAHHYWRDHDPASPRHDPAASAARRGAVAAVYEDLDAACGELRAAFGEDALCLVVSDHGSGGASQRVVHLNRHLADCGLLRRRPATSSLDGPARRVRDAALRVLPPTLAQRVFRRARAAAARLESAARFAGIDWAQSPAFSEEANTQPGVWLNLAGREARGCIAASDHERVRREVIDALLDWKLPSGAAVVARARPREEVYEGPLVMRAPDIVVELALDAGYALSLVATPWSQPERQAIHSLAPEDFAGGRGRGMNGTHRPAGVLIATGAAASLELPEQPAIQDIAPTVLASLGIGWDEELDGLNLAPTRIDYSPEEEARAAERLRALGYLD